jgi:hypothetical protein
LIQVNTRLNACRYPGIDQPEKGDQSCRIEKLSRLWHPQSSASVAWR